MNDERALGDLLASMTPAEKVAQLRCIWAPIGDDGTIDLATASAELREGIGHIARPGSVLRRGPRAIAELSNALQRYLIDHTRLGIPALLHEEALAGVQTLGATCFPQAIGMSCTWDPALMEEMGAAIGAELGALGLRMAFAPVADVLRDPRWGRVEETYGEDAYLVGTMAASFVRGVQDQGIAATLKHFVGYSASSGGRNTTEVRIGTRELRDVHGLAFEIVIRTARARAVMAAYPVIDRVAPTADRALLTDYLRGALGFEGIVVSDYYGIDMLEWKHHVSGDERSSAIMALDAGVDADLPAGRRYGEPLLDAVGRGAISVGALDDAVMRVLRVKRDVGLLADPFVDIAAAPIIVHSTAHEELAQRAAEQTVVLLTNDGVLPVGDDVRRIAVVGPNADHALAMLGDYSYQIQADALAQITALASEMPALADIADELPPPLSPTRPIPDVDPGEHVSIPTLLDALRARARCEVSFVGGTSVDGGETDDIEAAATAAREADLAVVVVGDRSGILLSGTVGEGRDGARLELPGAQRRLVEAVLDTTTPTVVVLLNGRPFALDWLRERANAIVEAWFPGERGGVAISRILFGDVAPSGRLTVSFPSHPGVLPLTYDHIPMEGLGLYYDASLEPVFPFGHGLTYTSFEYSDLRVPEEVSIDASLTFEFSVTNRGARSGTEVCQIYVRDLLASVARPERELRAFARLDLASGERGRVTVSIPMDLLAFHDAEMCLVVEPGRHRVMIGASSSDIRLSAEVEIRGACPRVVLQDTRQTSPSVVIDRD